MKRNDIWNNYQIRYLDPVSTNDIKMDLHLINKTVSYLLDNNNGVIKGFNLYKIDNYKFKIEKGVLIIDDVFIEFIDDLIVDITDTFWYLYPSDGLLDTPGEYPIIAKYRYERTVKNPPVCEINIMKDLDKEPNINWFCLGIVKLNINRQIESVSFTAETIEYKREQASLPSDIVDGVITFIDGGEITD